MIKIFILYIITWIIATVYCHDQSTIANETSPASKDYKIYWNVPTYLCHEYGIYFPEISNHYEIIQNTDDHFRGNKIIILYHPGMFPAIIKSPNGSETVLNGGVPQMGNLEAHLELLREDLKKLDANFSGIGIINFEYWRPIYMQNWGSLLHYRNYSMDIERNIHPLFDNKTLRKRAVKKFEFSAQLFMEETIKTAKHLRPRASWGYYDYPKCFNLSPKQLEFQCDDKLRKYNDNLTWLWKQVDVLFPSIYLSSSLTTEEIIGLINGRLIEAKRIASGYENRLKILPYFSYRNTDSKDFVSDKDIDDSFNEVLNHNVDGHIIWGSSNDFASESQCNQFKLYLHLVLGPSMKNIRTRAKQRKIE